MEGRGQRSTRLDAPAASLIQAPQPLHTAVFVRVEGPRTRVQPRPRGQHPHDVPENGRGTPCCGRWPAWKWPAGPAPAHFQTRQPARSHLHRQVRFSPAWRAPVHTCLLAFMHANLPISFSSPMPLPLHILQHPSSHPYHTPRPSPIPYTPPLIEQAFGMDQSGNGLRSMQSRMGLAGMKSASPSMQVLPRNTSVDAGASQRRGSGLLEYIEQDDDAWEVRRASPLSRPLSLSLSLSLPASLSLSLSLPLSLSPSLSPSLFRVAHPRRPCVHAMYILPTPYTYARFRQPPSPPRSSPLLTSLSPSLPLPFPIPYERTSGRRFSARPTATARAARPRRSPRNKPSRCTA